MTKGRGDSISHYDIPTIPTFFGEIKTPRSGGASTILSVKLLVVKLFPH
jgi:hypothetical protein